MKNDRIQYLVGEDLPILSPIQPYADITCEFLDELSKKLRKDKKANLYPDVMGVAFWCRKANIIKLKQEFLKSEKRIGRGVVFHIAPSNVPVNFVFSYFFGILSGNSNIVRVPSKNFPQTKILCKTISEVLEEKKFECLKKMTLFVNYEKEDEITEYFSCSCDARIIWGGDRTVEYIQKFRMKERAIEITFSDRYSIGIISCEKIIQIQEDELVELAKRFYNDTYLMDQNACSTPHLIFWYGEEKYKVNAQERFWRAVAKEAQKYELEPIKVMDKYTQICEVAMNSKSIGEMNRYKNLLYTVELKELESDISKLRGKFGLFYQYQIKELREIIPYITSKIQSLIYFGVVKEELAALVWEYHLTGIDRIVPFGSSLDMGVYWDGYDIIGQLSRYVQIE